MKTDPQVPSQLHLGIAMPQEPRLARQARIPLSEPARNRELELLGTMPNLGTVPALNGQFIKVDTPFGAALVPDNRVTETLKPTLQRSALKIPHWVFEQTLNFYRRVYVNQHTEVMVLWYHNRRTQEWKIVVPWQDCSGGSAHYDLDREPPLDLMTGEIATVDPGQGWLLIGTSHSHCMMHAFWSGGDDACELPMNGFHVTYGRVMDPMPELACSIVIRKQRFVLSREDIFEVPESGPVPETVLQLVAQQPGTVQLVDVPEGDVETLDADDLTLHASAPDQEFHDGLLARVQAGDMQAQADYIRLYGGLPKTAQRVRLGEGEGVAPPDEHPIHWYLENGYRYSDAAGGWIKP